MIFNKGNGTVQNLRTKQTAVMKALDDIGYSTAPAPNANWATAEVHGGDRKRLKQISDQNSAALSKNSPCNAIDATTTTLPAATTTAPAATSTSSP